MGKPIIYCDDFLSLFISSEEVSFEDDIDSVNVDFEETDSMEECETWFDSQEDFDMSEDTLNGDMSVTCDQTEAENSASDEGKPIYHGSKLSVGQSMLLILLYATRHQ